jgi:hypothetical protein
VLSSRSHFQFKGKERPKNEQNCSHTLLLRVATAAVMFLTFVASALFAAIVDAYPRPAQIGCNSIDVGTQYMSGKRGDLELQT